VRRGELRRIEIQQELRQTIKLLSPGLSVHAGGISSARASNAPLCAEHAAL